LRVVAGILLGGIVGAALGLAGYMVAYRNDGDGTLGLLLAFGSLTGGVPGFVLGATVGSIGAHWSCRKRGPEDLP
jgi:hypothetical protein